MAEVIEEMKAEGIQFPAVIRFHDILRSQVEILNETFQQTIETAEYQGKYVGVYPIKVNQMREVVEEIPRCSVNPTTMVWKLALNLSFMAVMAYNDNPGGKGEGEKSTHHS